VNKEEERLLYKSHVLTGIDDTQRELETLTTDIDFYLGVLTPEEFDIDGKALRDIQARISRLDAELNTFRRRMV
jgi:hypothetical protein